MVLSLFLCLKTEVRAKINNIQLESLEYRGAKLYWEVGNPMPEERLKVFLTVMDSLADDVDQKYSLGQNPTDFFYLTAEDFYFGKLTRETRPGILAITIRNEVFLSPLLVDSNNDKMQIVSIDQFQNGPWKQFEDSQFFDNGYFAMVLIHEYVHVLQHNHKSYLLEYAKSVGWQGEGKPDEDENFYRVLSSYSLENPKEDMSETFMYSYLCSNNLEGLSEARLRNIEEFWAIPEYCRNFH